jgi:hypothetical protein
MRVVNDWAGTTPSRPSVLILGMQQFFPSQFIYFPSPQFRLLADTQTRDNNCAGNSYTMLYPGSVSPVVRLRVLC